MATIKTLVCEKLIEVLKTELQAVPIDNNSYVEVVRFGRLQDNPMKGRNGVYALVHIGDPADPKWRDHVASEMQGSAPIEIGTGREVGGGSSWWRAFAVEWGLFLIKQRTDRDDSRDLATLIEARCQKAIAEATLGLVDEFGEVAIQAFDVIAETAEGGGPPASFIWRGKVLVRVLTRRPY